MNDDMYLRPLQQDVILDCIDDFKYAPARLLDDKDFILKKAFKVSRESPNCYILLSTRLRSDKEVMIAAMKHNGALLNNLPYGVTIDHDILKAALSCNLSRNQLVYHHYSGGLAFSRLTRHVLYYYFSRGEMIDREILHFALKKEKLSVLKELVELTKLPKDIMLDALQVAFFILKNYKLAYQLLEKYFYAHCMVNMERGENSYSLEPYAYYFNNFGEPIDGMEFYPPFRKWSMMEVVERLTEKDHAYFAFFTCSKTLSAPTILYMMKYMKSGRMTPALAKNVLTKTLESKCVDEIAKKLALELVTFAFGDKVLVKKMISMYPGLFSSLPEDLKTDSSIIQASLPYSLALVPENARTEEFYLQLWNKKARLFFKWKREHPKMVHDVLFSINAETGKLILRDHVTKYSNFLRYLYTSHFDGISSIEEVISPSQVAALVRSSKTGYIRSTIGFPHMSKDEVAIELVKKSAHTHFMLLNNVNPDLVVPLITKQFIIHVTYTYNCYFSTRLVHLLWDRDMIILKKIFERTERERLNKEIAESLAELVRNEFEKLVELSKACPSSLQYFSKEIQEQINQALENH